MADTIITTEDGLKLQLKNSKYEVIGYTGSPTTINIPSEYNNIAITSIGDEAFSDCTSLISVTMGEYLGNSCQISSIGSSAFEGCSLLTSVIITPSEDITIKDKAFSGCLALKDFTIYYKDVLSIGDEAFKGCEVLTNLDFPGNKLKHIGNNVFDASSNIIREESGLQYVSINNNSYHLIYGRSYTLATYDEHNLSNETIIISKGAFNNNTHLESIKLPDTLRIIESHAFNGCNSLTNIEIPNNVTNIGGYAFAHCSKLTNVNIGSSVESIGDGAFEDCELLTSVAISSSSVTSIGNFAFAKCGKLITVTMPASVTNIGGYAFAYCNSLTSINIPSKLTSIGSYAFSSCDSLTSVNYNGTINSWARIAFYSPSSNPLYYAKNLYINDVLVTEVVLTTATKISNYAFYNCDSLTSVTIGNSVTSIGDYAFFGCTQLKYIYIKSNRLKTIGDDAFAGSNSISVIINFSNLEIEKGSDMNGQIAKNASTIYKKLDMQQRDNIILCYDNERKLAAISCEDVEQQTLMLPEQVNTIEFSFLKSTGSIYIPATMEIIRGSISNCDEIYYHSDSTNWSKVVKTDQALIESEKIYYYSATDPGASAGNYWHDGGQAGFKISSNKDELLLDSKNLKITQDGNVTATDITLLGSLTANNNLIDSKNFKVSQQGSVIAQDIKLLGKDYSNDPLIDSKNFTVSQEGSMRSKKGFIGGFEINEDSLIAKAYQEIESSPDTFNTVAYNTILKSDSLKCEPTNSDQSYKYRWSLKPQSFNIDYQNSNDENKSGLKLTSFRKTTDLSNYEKIKEAIVSNKSNISSVTINDADKLLSKLGIADQLGEHTYTFSTINASTKTFYLFKGNTASSTSNPIASGISIYNLLTDYGITASTPSTPNTPQIRSFTITLTINREYNLNKFDYIGNIEPSYNNGALCIGSYYSRKPYDSAYNNLIDRNVYIEFKNYTTGVLHYNSNLRTKDGYISGDWLIRDDATEKQFSLIQVLKGLASKLNYDIYNNK